MGRRRLITNVSPSQSSFGFKWQDSLGVVGAILAVAGMIDIPFAVRIVCFIACAVCLSCSFVSHTKWPPLVRGLSIIGICTLMGSLIYFAFAARDITIPQVSVVTQYGLTLTDFPDLSISSEMSHELRRQNLAIKNPNRIDILNFVMRFQLPEPVVGPPVIEYRPAGVDLTWNPCRLRSSVIGSAEPTSNGGVSITSDAKPGAFAGMFVTGDEVCSAEMNNKSPHLTGIYQLKIDRLPAGEVIRLGFLTSDGEGTDPYREKVRKLQNSTFCGDGTYQVTSNNQTDTRSIYVQLTFDERTRRVSSMPSSREHGECNGLATI